MATTCSRCSGTQTSHTTRRCQSTRTGHPAGPTRSTTSSSTIAWYRLVPPGLIQAYGRFLWLCGRTWTAVDAPWETLAVIHLPPMAFTRCLLRTLRGITRPTGNVHYIHTRGLYIIYVYVTLLDDGEREREWKDYISLSLSCVEQYKKKSDYVKSHNIHLYTLHTHYIVYIYVIAKSLFIYTRQK